VGQTYYRVNEEFQRIDSPQRSPQVRRGKAAYFLLCVPAATSAVEPKIDNFVNTIISLSVANSSSGVFSPPSDHCRDRSDLIIQGRYGT